MFCLLGVMLPGCQVEEMEYVGQSGGFFKVEQDTFHASTGVNFTQYDTIPFEWSVKTYVEGRWRGVFKWQGPWLMNQDEAFRVFFKMGWSEVDFLKVATNEGNVFRGNIQVKYPSCVTSKKQAEEHTEAIYYLLLEHLHPVEWVVEKIECK